VRRSPATGAPEYAGRTLGQHLDENSIHYGLTIDQNAVAVEDDEVKRHSPAPVIVDRLLLLETKVDDCEKPLNRPT
jgi:hypothetical protein